MAAIIIPALIGTAISAGLSYLSYVLSPNPDPVTNEGPRLDSLNVTAAQEGSNVNRLFGRMRLGGQIIWATQFREVVNTTTEKVKTGGKGGSKSQTVTTTTYLYYISFAVAFCEGNAKADISRVWADGTEIDLSKYTFRFYPGSQTQGPDPKIQAVEGSANTPNYRGIAYVVFDELPLADFGNRIPQITAEIVVPLDTPDPDDIQNSMHGVTLIPASGETIYGTQQYNVVTVEGASFWTLQTVTKPDNVHNSMRIPDAVRSLGNLVRVCDELDAIELVVSWFATDLRAGECRIIPKHEDPNRNLTPNQWQVAGYTRATAERVSLDPQGRPYFGGTPDDTTVVEMIQYIKNVLGKRVIFYPFIMCDIPPGNTLPNPYSDNAATAGQPTFPWRGRITQSPAAGYAGTVDKTATAATQINNFFTRTQGYRAMILHYANLCASAGGVDGFIIGSELIGLTTSRSAAGTYPAVSQLMTLADDVKAIVGSGTKVGYAADWSEQVHETDDGYWFHLDPLWSKSSIDFVGIDNYLPLSDWRDGGGHLDYDGENGPTSEFDLDYLRSNIEGGEYFDWYYASYADRVAQNRTPITDGDYDKPWMFRRKDFRSWWANYHYNRPAWVEDGSPTGWVPYSKPIWFTEIGCPCVDKGTNQPNVFYDPKSSESFFPYFSRGTRDDFISRVYNETMLTYWRDNSPTEPGNPSNRMLAHNNIFVWTWDARPYPDFPARSNVWSDGDMWYYGHWLTGRIDAVPLARLVAALCRSAGLDDSEFDTQGLYGPGALVRGFVLNDMMTPRDAIQSLASAFLFDAFESQGKLVFTLRSNVKQLTVSGDLFVINDSDAVGATLTRGQETELPSSVKITFIDESNDYQTSATDGKTSKGYSQNSDELTLPVVLTEAYVRSLADSIVQQAWVSREKGTVNLPPSLVMLDTGDVITLPIGNRDVNGRISKIDQTEMRAMEFATFDIGMFALPPSGETDRLPPITDLYGAALVEWVDVPLLTGQEPSPWAPMLVAHADPWPGQIAVYRQLPDTTYEFSTLLQFHNTIGELLSPLYSGPTDRWDRSNSVYVRLYYGALSSVEESAMLQSALAVAVQNSDGEWEVLQFATATLTAPGEYLLTNLIRGQLGTKIAMRNPVAVGARVVLLEASFLTPLNVTEDIVSTPLNYSWGPAQYAQTDPSYQIGERYGTRAGLRPYTPCNLRVHRYANSDLALRFQRRTRFGGDNWTAADVPLNEEFERYRVRVYDGSTVVREIEVTEQEFRYTVAQQAADFGGNQVEVKFGVAQFGSRYGGYGPETIETVLLGSSE